MTEASFRKLALTLPETAEASHMGHADFRVKGKIFATLPFEGDAEAKDNVPGGVGVLKLTPDQQDEFIEAWPKCFEPVPGAWGLRGYTRVLLRATSAVILRRALDAAWANIAPKSVVARLEAIIHETTNHATATKKQVRAKPRRTPQ